MVRSALLPVPRLAPIPRIVVVLVLVRALVLALAVAVDLPLPLAVLAFLPIHPPLVSHPFFQKLPVV